MYHPPTTLLNIVLLATSALLSACNREILNEQVPTTTQTVTDINAAPVKISYEMETFTVTKFDNPPTDQSAFLYRNRSLPVVTRSAVKLGVYEDGSSDWVITNLEPTFRIPSPQAAIPADDSPKTYKTVIHGGNASFYDKTGKLLHAHQMQIHSYKDLIESLRENANPKTIAARVAGGAPDIDIDQRLAEARKKGYVVTEVGKGFVSIRAKVDRNSQYAGTRFDGSETQMYSVEMWDIVNKVMLGTRLYDEKGDRLLSQTLFKYDDGRNLTQTNHQTYGIDPRKVAFVTTTDSYFRDLEFVSSITKK